MLILLPPSEGKTPPARGRPVDLDTLTRPDLRDSRTRALRELAALSSAPDAVERLGVGTSLAAEVARNVDLATAPAAQAATVYTGVLYEAAGLADMTGTGRRRANTSVRIISALWGVLSPADRIPAYRLSMSVGLPGIGSLAPYWARALGEQLTQTHPGVVIDCRSSAYVPAWRPPSGTAWLTVRVVADRDGKRTVVSHHAKHTRGMLTRHLLTRPGAPPRTVAEVRRASQELVGTSLQEVSLHPATGAGPDTLELVVAQE
ncbi:peroxide stress protein YaaA [Ruania alkalisoli]|uniref:Peroxide stress protein YaaA n=1 Tax=Ruania alkalisoli TaxID=2779775 RepID=A0A7M1SNP2_9MICO|nr:peroxide stress protein YaaA [Ruania alkalisoli]QOR69196.1 peroxide stress protein YaaA [Ruania alkalisoli]